MPGNGGKMRYLVTSILVMAAVSYLPRVIPLVLFRRKITNKYVCAFLSYMPYAVLAAMIIPDVFGSTGNIISSLCGFAVALVLSYMEFGLLPVALSGTAAVFIAEQIIKSAL